MASGVSTSSTTMRCLLKVGYYALVWGDLLLLVALTALSIIIIILKNRVLNLRQGQELVGEILGCVILSVYLKYPSLTATMLSGTLPHPLPLLSTNHTFLLIFLFLSTRSHVFVFSLCLSVKLPWPGGGQLLSGGRLWCSMR